MFKRILIGFVGFTIIFYFLAGLAIAEDSRAFLQKAIKDIKPINSLSAVKYLETSFKENGFRCIVAIILSKKQKGKYWLNIYQLPSKGQSDWEHFTRVAIIRTAVLLKNVKWEGSDLFLAYSSRFKINDKSIGWAYISIDDCIEARTMLLSSGDKNKFKNYWKSKIKYLTEKDPKPDL